MNVERRQAAADPQTKPRDLGCESACRLPESTPTIAVYYYYSARKLILIIPSRGGLTAESTCVAGYIAIYTESHKNGPFSFEHS